MPDAPRLLRLPEVAQLLNVPQPTLRYWRANHEGPPSFLLGGRLRYDEAEVLAWLAEQRRADATHS